MNILIIKTGALGDVLRSSFIAQALKEKYLAKKPVIYWITSRDAADLISSNVYVDFLVLKEDKNKLSEVNFDLVINLEEDEENCKFAGRINTKEIIGFYYSNYKIIPSASAKEWFDMSILGNKPENDILKKKNKKTHRQIIGEMVKVQWQKYEPFLRLNINQMRMAENFLRRHRISRSELVVGINTGAADRWPKALSVKKTALLIDQVYRKYKAHILLFGGPNERERNKEIQKYTTSPIIDTGCGNDLIEFPALVSLCSVFITTDSLGLHVALALKRKTIALIGPTSPAEIDMYSLGDKVVAKSKDVCTYKTKTDCMDKIEVEEIMRYFEKTISQKITLIITAYKEPKTIGKAIESALNQTTNRPFEIIVSAPDDETINATKKYCEKNKNVHIFRDPGRGKSYALNLLFEKIKSDILILTDGDVFISKNSIGEISNILLNPQIGCVTGRPVPAENKSTKYGYWANFLFEAAHQWRKRAYAKHTFIECSAYLFAFRKSIISKIPLDVAEDSIIPYYFWQRGYSIGYAEKAEVYVKNVDNWKDWIEQKSRTSKAHETLDKYVDTKTTPRSKTFMNEIKGVKMLIDYPSNLQEISWTVELILARLYMWIKVMIDTKLSNKEYHDAWKRVESTK